MFFAMRMLACFSILEARGTVASDDAFVRFVHDATTLLFPPIRVSAHLCRAEQEEAVSLSRVMSRSRLAHEIHRDFDGFDTGVRHTFDHRVLYVLDLDCEYAIRLLRAANASGMFVAPMKWLLLQDPRIRDQSIDQITETFQSMAVFPDSDVLLARRLRDDFMEIRSVYRPSPYRQVILEDRGNWTADRGVRVKDLEPASRRRRNLQRTPLRSCLVMTDPDTINHLTDYENKHIDPITKVNYPWILNMVDRMNATVSFRISNTWGYPDENGSWSGMIGMLQRREIDIGGTGLFLTKDRIGVVDYLQLYTHTRSRFVFRQPLLSTVRNIFTLPFQRSVWIAIGVFLLLVLVLLYVSSKWEYRQATSEYWETLNPAEQTISDNLMVVLGAVAQQGYYYEPYRVPPRIVTLMLLVAALSLYTSYTANIVALLQSTTDSIKTVADLLNSPLKLGVQDVAYNRYFFKTFQDPVRKAIVDQKIESKGQKDIWMTMHKGVARVRSELFAFHGELGTVYEVMQKTYREEEKCGITEINFLNVLYPLLAMEIQSPYREIVRNTFQALVSALYAVAYRIFFSALLMRETGLKNREEYRLYTNKPQCQGQTVFISIGFTECYFALVSMGYGTLLSVAVLVFEHLWHRRRTYMHGTRAGGGEDNNHEDVVWNAVSPEKFSTGSREEVDTVDTIQ